MFPANLFFWTHVYNAGVKAATNLSGRKVGPCRKPVLPLTGSEMAELKEALRPLGI
jgi:dihydrodipicolinate synthase/N-acetylneuraminate lyase